MAEKEKILIKVFGDSEVSKFEWKHLCYVDKDLCTSFLDSVKRPMVEICQVISDWYADDFKKSTTLKTQKEVDEFRETIKSYYKEVYPDIFNDSNTDRQGWVRVWVTKHMKEALADERKSD